MTNGMEWVDQWTGSSLRMHDPLRREEDHMLLDSQNPCKFGMSVVACLRSSLLRQRWRIPRTSRLVRLAISLRERVTNIDSLHQPQAFTCTHTRVSHTCKHEYTHTCTPQTLTRKWNKERKNRRRVYLFWSPSFRSPSQSCLRRYRTVPAIDWLYHCREHQPEPGGGGAQSHQCDPT